MRRKEEACDYIRAAILNNVYRQGEPIREMDIAEELHMSRTPIREAIRDLEAEGLIVSYASKGAFVTTLTLYDVEEICDIRTLIEVWSLERGFYRISDKELDLIQGTFERAWREHDWETNHSADRSLHRTFLEKSGSKRIVQFMNNLNTQIERIRLVSAKEYGRSKKSYDEHMEIIQAIRDRDLEHSREALRRHLQSVGASAVQAARVMEAENSRFGK